MFFCALPYSARHATLPLLLWNSTDSSNNFQFLGCALEQGGNREWQVTQNMKRNETSPAVIGFLPLGLHIHCFALHSLVSQPLQLTQSIVYITKCPWQLQWGLAAHRPIMAHWLSNLNVQQEEGQNARKNWIKLLRIESNKKWTPFFVQ